MKILLVEPAYKVRFAPLGLMKLSAMYKNRGDEVTFVQGRKKLYNKEGSEIKFDKICITSLFTYFYKETIETILYYKKHQPKAEIQVGGIFASIMPDFIEKYTNIRPHIGLLPEAEKQKPDQSLIQSYYRDIKLQETDYRANYDGNYEYTSLAFTSRGCIRKCAFCVVPKIEGKLTIIPDWEKYIDIKKPTITFMDNNWFSKPIDILKEDISKIKFFQRQGIKSVDFNQALDARLFTHEIAKSLEGVKLKPIRFAFDNKSEDGPLQNAVRIAREHGLMHSKLANKDWNAKQSNSSIYVLYNFKDTPEFFYHRIREIVKCGAAPTPLRYCPIDNVKKKYISPNWNELYIKNIRSICSGLFSRLGSITPHTQDEFEFAFGKNYNEFIKIISDRNCDKKVQQKIINRKILGRRNNLTLE